MAYILFIFATVLTFLSVTRAEDPDESGSVETTTKTVTTDASPTSSRDSITSPSTDCKKTKLGTDYRGTLSHTVSGKNCQRWDSQFPHKHALTQIYKFPDPSLGMAANLCRNPDNEPGGPWCYTTDPQTRWEYCDVPFCDPDDSGSVAPTTNTVTADASPTSSRDSITSPSTESSGIATEPPKTTQTRSDCKKTKLGTDYRGTLSHTVSSKNCQRWDSQFPHKHTLMEIYKFPDPSFEMAANLCRNPDNEPGGPWCYTTDRQTRWEYCDVSLCDPDDSGSVASTTNTVTADASPTSSRDSITSPSTDCRHSTLGTEYVGSVSQTLSNITCQNWSSQTPHPHPYTSADAFRDLSLNDSANKCRNPNGRAGGPWCYTVRADVEWEYCPVPACDCKQTKLGTDYRGTVSHTVSGKNCQRWDLQFPHKHTRANKSMFPDSSLEMAANLCRNPDNEPGGPWCYTTDPQTRWEYCDLPFCDCKKTKLGTDYRGTVSHTVSGKNCQRWDSQFPHKHTRTNKSMFPDTSLEMAANLCRNPNNEPGGPWCYTTDPQTRWEYCDVPFCDPDESGSVATTTNAVTTDASATSSRDSITSPSTELSEPPKTTQTRSDCKKTKLGTDYRGTVSHTVSGKECQRWDSQFPHQHTFPLIYKFPDPPFEMAVNLCRNPDNEPGGPWCYTTDLQTRWEYCDVPFCELDDIGAVSTSTNRVTENSSDAVVTSPSVDIDNTGPFSTTTDTMTVNTSANSSIVPATSSSVGCKYTKAGTSYVGSIATTVSGKTCQRWDQQTPHKHNYMNPDWFPDHSLSDASNFCRNTENKPGVCPWCYTADRNMRWEYCNIPMCGSSTIATEPPKPTKTRSDCRHSSLRTEYVGSVSQTLSNITCQNWSSQTPHPHPYTSADAFPDLSLDDSANKCRNPNGRAGGPWCYTVRDDVEWEYCPVPACDCKQTKLGTDYRGTLSHTVSGKDCQRWDSQFPHKHALTQIYKFPDPSFEMAVNLCRNPDNEPGGPWCYTTDPQTRWEYCDVPFCDCKTTEAGLEYGGHMSKTRSGKTCQKWATHAPHCHDYDKSSVFPNDESVPAAHNYCRNPDQHEPKGPWCYTTDPYTRWEYCDIPVCGEPIIITISSTTAVPITTSKTTLPVTAVASTMLKHASTTTQYTQTAVSTTERKTTLPDVPVRPTKKQRFTTKWFSDTVDPAIATFTTAVSKTEREITLPDLPTKLTMKRQRFTSNRFTEKVEPKTTSPSLIAVSTEETAQTGVPIKDLPKPTMTQRQMFTMKKCVETDSTNGGLTVGAIVGIVMAMFLIFVMVVVVYYVVFKSRCKPNPIVKLKDETDDQEFRITTHDRSMHFSNPIYFSRVDVSNEGDVLLGTNIDMKERQTVF